jgi:hypothetical protein
MHIEGNVPKYMFPEGYSVWEQETKAKHFKRLVINCENSGLTSCEYRNASLNDGDTFCDMRH